MTRPGCAFSVASVDGREVEGIEALHRREPGGTDPALDRAAFPVDQLQFDEAQQVAGMIDAITRAFPGQLLILAQYRRQLELLEVMRQQNLRRACRGAGRHLVVRCPAHAASSGRSVA